MTNLAIDGLISSPSFLANFKNVLDGGDFTVNPWQRGTSFTGIANTLTYGADRWFAVGGGSSSIAMSKQANSDVAGLAQALQWGRTNGNANTAVINLGQVMETADSIRLQGQPITLSFWVKGGANAPASINVQVISGSGIDQSAANLVAGAWTSQANVVNATLAPTTVSTRYAFSGTVPANATQLGVLISYTPTGTAGANEWLQFMGFQLEAGPAASVFEHRDIQVELEICQRYFYQANEPAAGVVVAAGMITGASNIVFELNLPVQMRAAPTVTVATGSWRANIAGTATATTVSAGSTHTPNYLTINGTGSTMTAGQASLLQGNGGAGNIQASADY